MNEEISIEQQLQVELSRLKKAIEYIEQAEKNVQKVQLLNYESQAKYDEILKSNEDFKTEINAVRSVSNNKFEQIISDLDKLSKTVDLQNQIIQQNQKKIELLTNLKWYQKLFG